jgi:hypothetical protein
MNTAAVRHRTAVRMIAGAGGSGLKNLRRRSVESLTHLQPIFEDSRDA